MPTENQNTTRRDYLPGTKPDPAGSPDDKHIHQHVRGLPILSRSEWTDVDLGENCSSTFRWIGDRILLSIPAGRMGDAAMKNYLRERAGVLDAMPGRRGPFVEVSDFSGMKHRPVKAARGQIYEEMGAARSRMLGLIVFNAGPAVKQSIEIAIFLGKTRIPVSMVDDVETAVDAALQILEKSAGKKQPGDGSDDGAGERSAMEEKSEPDALKRYVREIVSVMDDIDWESDDLESGSGIDPSHPCRPVFDAISLVKKDLAHLFRERGRAERINKTLFRISSAVNATSNLDELYESIHHSLSEIIDATNFFFALYDREDDSLSFPYFVDETTDMPYHLRTKSRLKEVRSFTGKVISTGKPLLIRKKDMSKLYEKDGVKPYGPAPEVWLGAPLAFRGAVIGAMVVQNYTDSESYDETDMDILLSVSEQVAIAIEQKRAEEALLVEKAHIERLFEGVREGIVLTDESGIVTRINSEFTRLFGYPGQEAEGRVVDDLIVPADGMEKAVRCTRLVAKGENMAFEAWRKKKDGSSFKASVIATPIPLDADRVGLCGIYRDITEQNQAKNTLLALYHISKAVNSTKSLDELFELIHHSLDGVLDTRNFYIALYDNQSDIISFPYLVDERDDNLPIIGASRTDSMTSKVIRRNKALLFDEARLRRMDESDKEEILGSRPRVWLGVPLSVKGDVIGAVAVQSYTDPNAFSEKDIALLESVSEQIAHAIESKRTEEALFESEKRYKTLFDNAGDAILFHDMGRVFLDVNAAASERYGYTREEFLSMAPRDLGVTGSKDLVSERIEQIRKSGQLIGESVHVRRNGERFPCELNSRFIQYNGKPAVLSIVRDITERRRADEEKRRMEAQLQNARKMEAIGTLAGGVAHDLNNILSGLVSYPDLLLLDLPDDSPLRPAMRLIRKSGNRAAAIVHDLLTLARRGVVVTEPVHLNLIIQTFMESPEYKSLLGHHAHVRVETDLAPNLSKIPGSPSHLTQIVLNLASNAAESMPDGGVLSISTKNRRLDKPLEGRDDVKAGECVALAVSDSGPGLSTEDMERIFEPFYTKKVMGRSGTGLGMAVVWGTVKDHEGYIDIQTEEGKGSCFTLYFPITVEESPRKSVASAMDDFMGRGESIVVVDDVEEQRKIASRILGMLNYSVKTFSSGEDAVEYMIDHAADLLILDMIMDPGIDGLETYKRIISRHPGQKAIIASGYSETRRVREARKLGVGAYVRKPYLLKTIGPIIREELDKERG